MKLLRMNVHTAVVLGFLLAMGSLGCGQGAGKAKALNWTMPDLEGHWRLHGTDIVEEVPFLGIHVPDPDPNAAMNEWSPWDGYERHDLVFEGDSMYWVDFPIEASRAVHYVLDMGYLHVGVEGTPAYPVELVQRFPNTCTISGPCSADNEIVGSTASSNLMH